MHSEVFWFRRWGSQWHAAISWDSFLACPFFPLGCVWVFPVSWEGKQQDQDAVVGHQGGDQPRGETSVKITECPWAFYHPAFLLHSTSVFTESIFWEPEKIPAWGQGGAEQWRLENRTVRLQPWNHFPLVYLKKKKQKPSSSPRQMLHFWKQLIVLEE